MSYRHDMPPPRAGGYNDTFPVKSLAIAGGATLVGALIGFLLAPNHADALSDAASQAAMASERIAALEIEVKKLQNELSLKTEEISHITSRLDERNRRVAELTVANESLAARLAAQPD